MRMILQLLLPMPIVITSITTVMIITTIIIVTEVKIVVLIIQKPRLLCQQLIKVSHLSKLIILILLQMENAMTFAQQYKQHTINNTQCIKQHNTPHSRPKTPQIMHSKPYTLDST